MGNIKKFKPLFDHAVMYKDSRGLFVLGPFGIIGQYSKHPTPSSKDSSGKKFEFSKF